MTEELPWVIVGSGPAGCAAAEALILRGVTPIVLDGGIESHPESQVDGVFSRLDPGKKAWFGSVATYQQPDGIDIAYDRDVLARASFARGGFSRVWGATVDLPTEWSHWARDIRPTVEDLNALASMLPHAVTKWGDDALLGGASVPGSPNSGRAHSRFRRAATSTEWTTQPSVVAIDSRHPSQNSCRPCGECLNGCNRQSIWFSGDLVRSRHRELRLDYRPGMLVLGIEEDEDSAIIAIRCPDGSAGKIRAKRVLIAGGPISSAAIAIASGMVASVRIRDTSTAFIAALALGRERNSTDFHHGLSQWWIRDGEGKLMAQVYAPSRDNASRLAARIPGGEFWRMPARVMARRLHPIIAYLSMEDSDCLIVEPVKGKVRVRVQVTEGSRHIFESRLASLSRVFLRAGYLMPVRAAQITPAGSGYHMGASFPHGTESDSLGRLRGWHRTHFIDSSVMPQIKVGSITPTVMVNAIRIARECVEGAAG